MAKRMLIVDDSTTSRLMIRTYVRRVRPDWAFVEAAGGTEAMAAVFKERVDVASIDYNMPGMDGLTLARRIRAQLPELRMVIFTANIQRHLTTESAEVGAGLVIKPVTEGSVATMLRHFDA
ncbi:MAG: response regulator [Rhodospirillaceae bacterium]